MAKADEEVAEAKKRDPIFTFEDRMIEAGTTDRDGVEVVWTELRQAIDDAIQFAEDSPLPTPDQILQGVYS